MVVRTAGYNVNSSGQKTFAESLSIVDDILCINLEFGRKSFFEAYCLSCNDMHERSALNSGEDCLIEIVFLSGFLIGKNHTASGSAKSLVCGCCNNVRIREG